MRRDQRIVANELAAREQISEAIAPRSLAEDLISDLDLCKRLLAEAQNRQGTVEIENEKLRAEIKRLGDALLKYAHMTVEDLECSGKR